MGERSGKCHRMAAAMVAMVGLVSPAMGAWVVTEVPTLPTWSGSTQALAINDSGVICGVGNYVSGASAQAFRYDGQTLTELPPLAPAPPNYPFGYATAINRSGVVAGWSHNADGIERAVIWTGTTVTELSGPPDCAATETLRAYGINDQGVVVGYYVSTNGFAAAFYHNGTAHSLKPALLAAGLTGERSYAKDVNNNGLVCGEANDAYGDYAFFTYDIGTGTVNVLGKLYNPSGTGYTTAAMNDAGHVVGRGRTVPWDTVIRALLHDGTFHVIDDTVTVAQWAKGITNGGRVVGNAGTTSTGGEWAWYSDGVGPGSIVRVELPGWDREKFQGINNADVMVGYGRTVASPTDDRSFIVAPPPGDGDHDGGIGLDDYAQFAACLSGPAEGASFVTPSAACLKAFDFASTDGDVDLADFAEFQKAYEGL
jgi:hypothetical protein